MENRIVTTFAELSAAAPALGRLAAIKKPQKVVYHVAKLVKYVQAELKHFDESRIELVKKYGTERPATPEELAAGVGSESMFEITDAESRKKFSDEFTELCDVEVEIPWRRVKFSDLQDFEISAADVLALEPLMAFDEDERTAAPSPDATS